MKNNELIKSFFQQFELLDETEIDQIVAQTTS